MLVHVMEGAGMRAKEEKAKVLDDEDLIDLLGEHKKEFATILKTSVGSRAYLTVCTHCHIHSKSCIDSFFQ